jgi:3-phosphoshikimate 1-carboxyvinyltransferase
MDSLPVTPINHPLQAVVRVPGSKSLTNRALLIAALADGSTRLSNALFSDDSQYFTQALRTLGFDIQATPDNTEINITGLSGRIPAGKADLFIGNAGTAARFLSAFLTLGTGEFILDGDARMRERPIGDLVSALSQLGAKLEPSASDCPPVRISAAGLPGGKTTISGKISSQFLSALLMVAPYAQRPVEIRLSTELNSKPYVDMTISVMSDFGVSVERESYQRFVINAGSYHARAVYAIESDASAASYFFAAPAILGGSLRVQNISRLSRQGDIAFIDILTKMGCIVWEGTDFVEVTGPAQLAGVDVDMSDIPDTAQTLAVIAPFATSPTRIRGIASARVKETDRVRATCIELTRLGVHVDEHQDGLTIYPCSSIQPASIQTYNDHRMAMAFALIGLRENGVTIENPGCVSKTFPNYFSVLETLR